MKDSIMNTHPLLFLANAIRVAYTPDEVLANRAPLTESQRKAIFAKSRGGGGGGSSPVYHSPTVGAWRPPVQNPYVPPAAPVPSRGGAGAGGFSSPLGPGGKPTKPPQPPPRSQPTPAHLAPYAKSGIDALNRMIASFPAETSKPTNLLTRIQNDPDALNDPMFRAELVNAAWYYAPTGRGPFDTAVGSGTAKDERAYFSGWVARTFDENGFGGLEGHNWANPYRSVGTQVNQPWMTRTIPSPMTGGTTQPGTRPGPSGPNGAPHSSPRPVEPGYIDHRAWRRGAEPGLGSPISTPGIIDRR